MQRMAELENYHHSTTHDGNHATRSLSSKDAQTLGERLAGNLTKESGGHHLKLLSRYQLCVW